MRTSLLLLLTGVVCVGWSLAVLGQEKPFKPVTEQMLLNPSPDDWLMFSRTYDAQRFSPLNQINRENVGQLRMAWTRGLAPGLHQNIPIVYQGVMYVVNPGAIVQALDGASGDLIWEYRRKLPADIASYVGLGFKTKTLAIFEDVIFYTAPDGYLVALDARTGNVRWESMVQDYKIGVQHNSGPIVLEGKVVFGRSCALPHEKRIGCFIVANDARTGKEVWKFYTTAAPGEPGGDTWGNVPEEERRGSPWGLPGSYDPVRKLTYWGIGNPTPHTRLSRHGGNIDAIPRSAPAELYTNSTVALDAATGKLVWYYQHLPGDDWDSDFSQERILLRTALNPDAREVKWINPGIRRGEERDVAVAIGEPGGIWVLDRTTGQFLWATPFPYDVPEFIVSRIDEETGKTYINWNQVRKKDGEKAITCFGDTRNYWPMAYYPAKNSLYISYHDECQEKIADMRHGQGEHTKIIARPGSDPNAFGGIAKVDMATGRVQRFYSAPIGGNGAMLATAGNLIFWGDLNRRFRAFDADTGNILWEAIVGDLIENSTITYAVNGKQYVAVMTGGNTSAGNGPLGVVQTIKPPRTYNAIYAFALPDQR